jgi:hypothetical protein
MRSASLDHLIVFGQARFFGHRREDIDEDISQRAEVVVVEPIAIAPRSYSRPNGP